MFGVVASIIAGGFIDWIFWGMRENTIHSRLGHIQVTLPAYHQGGSAAPFDYLLSPDTAQQLTLEEFPEITAVAPRLALTGLISHGDNTVGFIGEGVEPDKEEDLSDGLVVMEGEGFSTDVPNGIFMGAGLARNLGVGVGDQVMLLATTAGGSLNGVEGTVTGLFQTSSKEFDDAALRLPIDLARQLLRTAGSHSLVLLLAETEQTASVLAQLQARFPGADSGVEFTPWYDLADFYHKSVKLFSGQMNMVRLIIAAIITLSISNILAMGVLERTGEIGTMMAMGTRRRQILALYVAEGLVLGLVGGALGGLLGFGLGTGLSAVGIPMPPPPGMETGYIGEIRVSWPLVMGSASLALVTALVGSLYPAWKASRLEIVDALRHNR